VAEALAQHENLGAVRADKLLSLRAQRRAFALLTGLAEDALEGASLRPEPPAPLLRPGDGAALSEAVEQALELAAARLDVELGAKRLRQAEVDHYPTLDLTASIASARNDATSTQGYSYLNRQVGLQYTVPIYTGGGLTAAQGQASRAYEASQAQAQAVTNRLEGQAWSLAAAEAGALERCRADELLVAAAREQLAFAARAYAQGLQTRGDLANAEATLARRSVDRVQNLLGVYRAQLGILKSLPTSHPLWQRWLAAL
jgi:outer membrane protein TolC